MVIASTLLEIKSREVLPQPEESVAEEKEAPETTSDIVGQLLQYKRYKNAAKLLDDRA